MHSHADQHIRELVLDARSRGVRSPVLTVVRPPGTTKEWVWGRSLRLKERLDVLRWFQADMGLPMPQERDVAAEGAIVDIFWDDAGRTWRSRVVEVT